jgi:hypothetical protein
MEAPIVPACLQVLQEIVAKISDRRMFEITRRVGPIPEILKSPKSGSGRLQSSGKQ